MRPFATGGSGPSALWREKEDVDKTGSKAIRELKKSEERGERPE